MGPQIKHDKICVHTKVTMKTLKIVTALYFY